MKYRVLTGEELLHFDEEFKQFLIVNGVYADQWEALNHKEPEKALRLVQLFSDMVLQRVYERINYVEFRCKESCLLFFLDKEVIHLISLQTKAPSSVDLSSPEGIQYALTKQSDTLSFFRSKKMYRSSREKEIHTLLEQGCVPSSHEFWQKMCEVTENEK
jgi:cag pathogenicity island protein 24